MTIANDDAAIWLKADADVFLALQQARNLAKALHFSREAIAKITISISEVARNSLVHARAGRITIHSARDGGKTGLVVVAEDDGPGIPDLELAMRDGYSTANSLGIGLPSAKRMMDEFTIVSEIGKGTVITMTKWKS